MFRRMVVSALFLSLLAPIPAHATPSSPGDLVLAMMSAINERDFDLLKTYIAEDIQRHSAATPGVVVENRDQFLAFIHQDLSAVPDAKQTVNMMFESGDMVAVHATYSGTQSGQMGPFTPSNKHIEIPFIGLLRVEDGKIAEIWVEWDNLNGLMQLGHLSPPAAPSKDE